MNQSKTVMATDLSLVMCTHGRTEEVDNFLKSISTQTRKPREIIIVDQNENDILSNILGKWQHELNLVHKRVNFKGVSRSRNYGAREANCSHIAFPDDDCLYPPSAVEQIVKFFEAHRDIDTAITAKIEPSQINKNDTSSGNYSSIISVLDLFKAKAETSNIFFKKSAFDSLPYIFNEKIGPGAGTPWGASDETDLLIRLLKSKKTIVKIKNIAIAHHSSQGTISKSLKYGMGRFEVILINDLGFKMYLINILQPIARFLKNPKPYGLLLCISTMIGRSGVVNILYKLLNKHHYSESQ